jgi:trk system potassium uptake protein TrkA
MRIIICGAGMVGYSIAQQLSKEDNEVTVIDYDAELIARINDRLDVTAIHGHASHPAVLKAARAEDADMLIAVTYSDEVNMVACQIGYSLFNIPTRIARIRHQDYLKPDWAALYSNDQLPLNVIISPEIEVAQAILRRLHAPGALGVIPFLGDRLRIVAVRLLEDCPVLNLPVYMVHQKAGELPVEIIGVVHKEKFALAQDNTVLHAGDVVYFAAKTVSMREVMRLFGHNEGDTRRALILGGGNIGAFLAQAIEQDKEHGIKAKVIEYGHERAQQIATELEQTTVLEGSALDREVLSEAGIQLCETVISVTNDDETNILSALLAKRSGAQRTFALVNNASYSPLLSDLGVDVTINPREITVSRILQHVRRGRIASVHAIHDGDAEIIEAEVIATSSMIGKRIHEVTPGKGVRIAAILRDGTAILPDEETVLQEKDHVIILALANMVRKVERMFSVSVEYF